MGRSSGGGGGGGVGVSATDETVTRSEIFGFCVGLYHRAAESCRIINKDMQ